MSWAIVALSLISALVTFFMGRRRRAHRNAYQANYAGDTKATTEPY
jgi:cbb3-type cytochrome oxidase subunit 3